jgi:hypothetical protein
VAPPAYAGGSLAHRLGRRRIGWVAGGVPWCNRCLAGSHDLNEQERKVTIKAVGRKEHNPLFIRGKEYQL